MPKKLNRADLKQKMKTLDKKIDRAHERSNTYTRQLSELQKQGEVLGRKWRKAERERDFTEIEKLRPEDVRIEKKRKSLEEKLHRVQSENSWRYAKLAELREKANK